MDSTKWHAEVRSEISRMVVNWVVSEDELNRAIDRAKRCGIDVHDWSDVFVAARILKNWCNGQLAEN